MNEGLLKKLRYKEGQALVVNPPEGYKLGIESKKSAEGKYDFVQLFVKNKEEVMTFLPQMIPTLKEDAMFWITYPKQSSKVKTDINRDILFSLIQEESEYRVVSNVAVDDKWSALRLRHKDKIKAK